MAKKKTAKKVAQPARSDSSEKVKLTPRDKKTIGSLTNLADSVVSAAQKTRDPKLEIPTRSLSNVRYNKSQRILEMGKNTTARQLFNLNQAKSYMQTMLAASGCKRLVESGKTTSIRGLYYLMKHTIAGTKEETFSDQAESDPIIEDLEVLLNSLREELHLYAQQRGSMVGNIILNDKGDTIDCSRMGSGGYGIPSIVEEDVIQFVECGADFVLHVEKDTVWQRFNEDKFWKKHNCILTHGSGQPPRGVRRLLHRLNNELKLPIYCVFDNDPWGYYIYSVIKQGSINLAYESKRMAVPDAKFLGLCAVDYERCNLNPSVQIALNDTDRKRAKQIAKYPWFEHKKTWQKEIAKLLENGFKLEVEALISQGLSYVTEEYVPQRLEEQRWLD
ncbi:DNA topoisomerase IV subunit A [Blastopirellula sp. JC732]|uniref:Type 2 DNA topoisomerase 6 subunit A n=1 Tax=Blastopirellula sediminis TaxID=2894196 RepID=A0A9X1MMZ7_9BACT|nr:DNA topoisomerase IV subunit A [Blastopirellula sediminis]MCC9607088.1 DNA topoisomerase IV subunit A [Blastopirellula sediminis]MCC9629619.1 DNA topoisomerase IV subunit A [Blastopirellula sediminis]